MDIHQCRLMRKTRNSHISMSSELYSLRYVHVYGTITLYVVASTKLLSKTNTILPKP